MKIGRILGEDVAFIAESSEIIEDYDEAVLELETMLEDIQEIRGLMESDDLTHAHVREINGILDEIAELTSSDEFGIIAEAVQRQFRRYGDKFLRQYRCTTGQKSGRMVSSPEKCGIRKDPRKVRQGKKAARAKKGQRVRKTLFTKRKTQSKRLSRMNKMMRGGDN
tara:strand:+ start:71 stop:568 length:498 start_codon:yes stop_codon:yes gene_type:complete